MTFSANFSLVLPEIVLAIAALVLLVAGAFRGKVGPIFTLAAVAALLAAAVHEAHWRPLPPWVALRPRAPAQGFWRHDPWLWQQL